MGFENGLCAMFEEPEEVKALLEYVCDFYTEVGVQYIDHAKPDIWGTADDTAAWANPFISAEMYREFLIPCHSRWAKMARDRGLPMTMHNCGKSEGVMGDLVKMGINMWEPAQTCNDLEAVKAKFGNRLAIGGGWDGRGRLLEPDVTDEEIIESAKETFGKLAKGGGFAWMGGFLGPVDDQETARKNKLMHDFVDEYAHDYYKKYA